MIKRVQRGHEWLYIHSFFSEAHYPLQRLTIVRATFSYCSHLNCLQIFLQNPGTLSHEVVGLRNEGKHVAYLHFECAKRFLLVVLSTLGHLREIYLLRTVQEPVQASTEIIKEIVSKPVTCTFSEICY